MRSFTFYSSKCKLHQWKTHLDFVWFVNKCFFLWKINDQQIYLMMELNGTKQQHLNICNCCCCHHWLKSHSTQVVFNNILHSFYYQQLNSFLILFNYIISIKVFLMENHSFQSQFLFTGTQTLNYTKSKEFKRKLAHCKRRIMEPLSIFLFN